MTANARELGTVPSRLLTEKEKDMSSTWTDEELRRIGRSTEVEVASRRPDGTLRPYVTIWGVRSGSDLYIRSAYGPQNAWFRRAVGPATAGSGPAVPNGT